MPKPMNTILTDLVKSDPQHFSILKVGDLVEGRVLERSAKKLFVDLGKHGTGVVYRGELLNVRETVKNLNPGDPIHGKVIAVDNDDGYIELSLSEAGKQKAWAEVQELQEKDEPFTVKISGSNKGGLVADLNGVQAFLPISQLANEHYPKVAEEDKTKIAEALESLVGTELKVKIIDVNPRTSKLIISEREASEISTRELAKNYAVGQIIEGIVSGVADFGVFVRFTDNPAVEGLIHVSELDHRIIENPKEVVKVDEAVKAKIIDIKDGKISLSLKVLKEDPWEKAAETYTEGQEVNGTVYAFNPFGAVINLNGGLQGQIHVTEFGSVDEMKKHLAQGKEYTFTIQSLKPQERRIVLKLVK